MPPLRRGQVGRRALEAAPERLRLAARLAQGLAELFQGAGGDCESVEQAAALGAQAGRAGEMASHPWVGSGWAPGGFGVPAAAGLSSRLWPALVCRALRARLITEPSLRDARLAVGVQILRWKRAVLNLSASCTRVSCQSY